MKQYGFLIHWGGEHAREMPTATMVSAMTEQAAWSVVVYQAIQRGWPILRIYKVREFAA